VTSTPESAGREPPGPSDAELAAALHARRRAAPRYRVFIGVGILIGVVAASVVTSVFADTSEYEASSVLGYTAVLLALVGGLLGGGVAVLLDRRR